MLCDDRRIPLNSAEKCAYSRSSCSNTSSTFRSGVLFAKSRPAHDHPMSSGPIISIRFSKATTVSLYSKGSISGGCSSAPPQGPIRKQLHLFWFTFSGCGLTPFPVHLVRQYATLVSLSRLVNLRNRRNNSAASCTTARRQGSCRSSAKVRCRRCRASASSSSGQARSRTAR